MTEISPKNEMKQNGRHSRHLESDFDQKLISSCHAGCQCCVKISSESIEKCHFGHRLDFPQGYRKTIKPSKCERPIVRHVYITAHHTKGLFDLWYAQCQEYTYI